MQIKNKKLGNQQNVQEDYEKIADWFDEHRSREFFEKPYLDKVISYLPSQANVLDLGCGMAEPVTAYFIKKNFRVVGVDGSQTLIDMAQRRYSQAEFIVGDMRTIQFDRKFQAIILWHSFFHLSHQDQRNMFVKFHNYLQEGGILLFTSGPQAGEVWSNNGGIEMYHASLSAHEYKELLAKYGFELLLHVVEDKDCGGATVWMAKLQIRRNVD